MGNTGSPTTGVRHGSTLEEENFDWRTLYDPLDHFYYCDVHTRRIDYGIEKILDPINFALKNLRAQDYN